MSTPPQPDFAYVRLGAFTYNVVRDPSTATEFLRFWLRREWETDHAEAPAEPWTWEWLSLLPRLTFRLSELPLAAVRPRPDLMSHEVGEYSFLSDLRVRAAEREESVLRGVSLEPLVVLEGTGELVDGYTRYWLLRQHGEPEVYTYLARRLTDFASDSLEEGDSPAFLVEVIDVVAPARAPTPVETAVRSIPP